MSDFKTLSALVPVDVDYPARHRWYTCRAEFLDGLLYDRLKYAFSEERTENGEYIKIKDRRPSVRYNLSAIIVNDSVSMLFGDNHFPVVQTGTPESDEVFAKLIQDISLPAKFVEAAETGSIGSVAIFMRVLDSRLYFEALRTACLTPTFDPNRPNIVTGMREKYKVSGRDLRDMGYTVDDGDLDAQFWFQREWDKTTEIWFTPWKVSVATKDFKPLADATRSVAHNLGFCPFVWVRNLPRGNDLDGRCTFELATDTQIEIEYQMSQGGRGLKYSSQPTLVLHSDDLTPKTHIAGDAIQVPTEGKAELLEIDGNASKAVIEYCRAAREMALEASGGNRVDGSNLSGATSGRAIEMMNQGLIWLASKLRVTYGDGALLDTLRMIVAASNKVALKYRDGTNVGKLNATLPLSLKWPDWCPPTIEDQMNQATAINTLRTCNVMSIETAVKHIAPVYDIEDVQKEVSGLEQEAEKTAQREISLAQETAKAKASARPTPKGKAQ